MFLTVCRIVMQSKKNWFSTGRSLALFVFLILTMMLSLTAFADGGKKGQGDGSQTPVPTSDHYILGPEDILNIVVRNVPDFSGDFPVRYDGKISFPVVGDVMVAGKTVSELQTILVKGLSSQLRDPQVTINVKTPRLVRIYVLGSVARPSVYDWKEGWRVSEVIAAAGGTTSPPEHLTAILFRSGEPAQKISLEDVLVKAVDSANVDVKPGDVINVQADPTIRVTVSGEVDRSGLNQLLEGQGAVEALGVAGGAKADAALSKSYIIRGDQTIPVNLYKAVVEGDSSKNVPVKDGDTLVIPQLVDQVSVVGTVQKPGSQYIPDGRPFTITQAIGEAGGLAPKALKSGIMLSRYDEKGNVKVSRIDFSQIGKPGHPDVTLQNRDVVFVAQSGATDVNQLNGFANLYYVLRLVGIFH